MTVTLSPPHCYFSLSDLCARRSCCVTANQLMTKFGCISCATLPWAAAVLSMGVNVPRIFVNVPNARFLQRQQVLLDVRESSRSMVLGCSPPLSSPNPAEAGKGTHHHYYLHMACIHTTLSTLLSLCCFDAHDMRLDDQY